MWSAGRPGGRWSWQVNARLTIYQNKPEVVAKLWAWLIEQQYYINNHITIDACICKTPAFSFLQTSKHGCGHVDSP